MTHKALVRTLTHTHIHIHIHTHTHLHTHKHTHTHTYMYHSSDYEPQPQQSGEVLHHRLQCTHILSHTKHTRIRKTHLSVYFSLNRAVSCGTTDRNAYTYSQTKYTNTHAYTYNTPERVLQPQQSGELLHHRLQYPHILSHTKHTNTHAYTYNTPERVLQLRQSGELLHHRL